MKVFITGIAVFLGSRIADAMVADGHEASGCDNLIGGYVEMVCQNTYMNTVAVATAAVTNNEKRFVYCSSMASYGAQETESFTGDMICRPQDPYGISKYSAELLLQCLCRGHGMESV